MVLICQGLMSNLDPIAARQRWLFCFKAKFLLKIKEFHPARNENVRKGEKFYIFLFFFECSNVFF